MAAMFKQVKNPNSDEIKTVLQQTDINKLLNAPVDEGIEGLLKTEEQSELEEATQMDELNNLFKVGGEDTNFGDNIVNKLTAPIRTGVSAIALGLGISTLYATLSAIGIVTTAGIGYVV